MCLAIPGKVQSIRYEYDGKIKMAKVSFGGIIKDATLDMVPDAQVGDYVLVHVGVAISIVDEAEAKRVFEYLEGMGEVAEELGESDYVPGQVDRPIPITTQIAKPNLN